MQHESQIVVGLERVVIGVWPWIALFQLEPTARLEVAASCEREYC